MYPPISPFGITKSGSSGGGGSIVAEQQQQQQQYVDPKRVLGGKGANLAEMSNLGLSVPPGFTITTECCDRYCKVGNDGNDDGNGSGNGGGWSQQLPPQLWNLIVQSLKDVEVEMQNGSEFGSPSNPLLLSVRSGAAISMPGMVRSCQFSCLVLSCLVSIMIAVCIWFWVVVVVVLYHKPSSKRQPKKNLRIFRFFIVLLYFLADKQFDSCTSHYIIIIMILATLHGAYLPHCSTVARHNPKNYFSRTDGYCPKLRYE